jgi:hypothetical protein
MTNSTGLPDNRGSALISTSSAPEWSQPCGHHARSSMFCALRGSLSMVDAAFTEYFSSVHKND